MNPCLFRMLVFSTGLLTIKKYTVAMMCQWSLSVKKVIMATWNAV